MGKGLEFRGALETELDAPNVRREGVHAKTETTWQRRVGIIHILPIPLRCAIERYKEWDEATWCHSRGEGKPDRHIIEALHGQTLR